jgi:hypothetical protein
MEALWLIIGGVLLFWFWSRYTSDEIVDDPAASRSRTSQVWYQKKPSPDLRNAEPDLSALPPDIVRQIEGLPSRSMEQLQRQWINTITMIQRVGQSRSAPFIAFRDALASEWAKRARDAAESPQHFAWPSTTAKGGNGMLNSGDWNLIGILSWLCYRVGATQGEPEGVRRQILDLCFDEVLPPINGLDYMVSWGPPGSSARLKKLASEIASFTRNGKRKRSANLSVAVADWEADLDYLYRKYYVGKFRFAWPRID